MRTCDVDGCERQVRHRIWCNAHYQRWAKYGDPLAGGSPHHYGPPLERFLAKIEFVGDCWRWTGKPNYAGYGYFNPNEGWSVRAHRWSYEFFVGAIPKGLDLDHTCHTRDPLCAGGIRCPHRLCVNPDHLEPVTRSENVRRGWHRGVRG